MAKSWVHGKPRALSNRGRHTTGRNHHASNNVAKRLVEFDFSITIPRERLRSGYRAGFQGAPLKVDSPEDHSEPRDSGRQGDDARTTQAPDPECAPEL